MISPKDIAVCAYVVGEDITRRRRLGHPVPPGLTALHRRLLDAVAVNGHNPAPDTPDPRRWFTAAQIADAHGVSTRTVRRHAEQYGGRKHGREWIFPPA